MKLLFIPGSGNGKEAWLYQTEYFTGSEAVVLPGHPEGEPCSSVGDAVAWRQYVEDSYSDIDPRVGKVMAESRIKIGPAVFLNDFLCCDKFDIMDQVHNIKLPTLVICGNEDEMTPVKYTKYLAGKIEGVQEVIIDGATHGASREKPGEYNQAIERFLASLG